jgi:hypothetical protein
VRGRSIQAVVAALALAAAGAAAAAEPTLSIRFFDKRIFFPGSEIPVMVTIANSGDSTYRFKLAVDRLFSLSFEARTPTNRALDMADAYKSAMGESKPVFYREVAIKPGEEYSFKEGLERFIRIDGPGAYIVTASFYPELVGPGSTVPLTSNALSLSVRPSPGLPPASDAVASGSAEILKPLPLPPDEVVRRTIVALQKGLWGEFFLYLDLESLLSMDPDRKAAFDADSDEGRRIAVERYRADLRAAASGDSVAQRPYFFDILETRYTLARGYVTVLEKFQDRQLHLIKEYTYELVRKGEVWYVLGYTVHNKGVE